MANLLSFLGDVGKKLHGVEAQLNPWDGGQTYNTVVNNAPVQQPQPRPQIQQAPQTPQFRPQGPQTPQPLMRGGLGLNQLNKTPQFSQDANAQLSQVKQQQSTLNPLPGLEHFAADTVHNIGNIANGVNNTVVKPIEQDVSKAVNTVAAPIAGVVGLGMAAGDQLFNGGRNTKNILNATGAQMNSNIQHSFVPQNVANGTATPIQFAGDIAHTGIHLAPYAVAPGGGALLDKFGLATADKVGSIVAPKVAAKLTNPVAQVVTGKLAGNVAGKTAGRVAQMGANAAITAPTFAALNAGEQGIQALQNGGQTSFDPNQANIAGLQAGAMTLAGDAGLHLANAGVKGAMKVASDVKVAAPAITHDNLVKTNPQYKSLNDNTTALAANIKSALDNGATPADVQPHMQALKTGLDNMAVMRDTAMQGGFAKVPFSKDQTPSETVLTPTSNDTSFSTSPERVKELGGRMEAKQIGEVRAAATETRAIQRQLSHDAGKVDINGNIIAAPSQKAKDIIKAMRQPGLNIQQKNKLATALENELDNEPTAETSVLKTPQVATRTQTKTSELAQRLQQPKATLSTKMVGREPVARNTPGRKVVASRSTSGRPYADNTPKNSSNQLDIPEYIKNQTETQEAARKTTNPSKLNQIKHEVSTKFIDTLTPLEKPLKEYRKSGQITEKNDLTPQLDRALRGDTIAGQYIKDNGLAHIIQSVKNTKEFDQYVIAKHAADLEKQGIKTGRNLEADQQLIQHLKDTYEPHARELMKYNRALLDKSVGYGLVSKEVADKLKKQYPNYVPANRIFGKGEKNVYKGNGSGLASKSTQSVVQRIKGSERAIESPLSSILNKSVAVVSQGERNKAAELLASYKDLPGNPFNLREMKPSETVGTKPTIAYLDKGKIRRFETTPEVEAAAKSLNKQQMGIISKIASVPTRALRLGATGINVGFALANVTKDIVSAAINSEHPFIASPLNPRVLGKSFKAALDHNSKEYGELVREGAGGTSFDIGRDQPRKNVAMIRADKNRASTAAYTVTHPAQLLRAVEDTIGRSEELNRAIQYYGNKEVALKSGKSEYEAKIYGANAARNNTVNFARHGEWGVALNSVIPYLNAGMQGSRTFLRNIKERPAQTLTKVAILSTMPMLTTTAWNLSDPNRKKAYDNINDYEKQGNIIIVPPNPKLDPKTGKWNVIKIPVSQEVANLNNAARNVFEAAMSDGSIDPKSIIGDLAGAATSLNVGSARQIANQVTPQAIKPVIEAITNQNLFTGNQIVPDNQKNLPASQQFGQYTSGTARALGDMLNVSPRQIDNFIKTTGGGAGQNFVNGIDNGLAATGMMKPDQVQGKTLQDSITGRFFGASATPVTDIANKQFTAARDKLMKNPQFQSMSPDNQQKAINRLQTDITAIEYNKQDTLNPNPQYPVKKLSTNQQSLAKKGGDLSKYITNSGSSNGVSIASNLDKQSASVLDKYNSLDTKGRQDWFNTQNDAQYQYDQAKYNNDKASGSISSIQDISRQKTLAKDKVGSAFPKTVRDLYNLSKADVNTYLSTPEPGVDKQKLADQLTAYDQALKNAGITKYAKFGGSSSSGRRSSKGRKAAASKAPVGLTTALNKTFAIKAPKTTAYTGSSGSIIKASTLKSTKLAPYTIKPSKATKFTIPKPITKGNMPKPPKIPKSVKRKSIA